MKTIIISLGGSIIIPNKIDTVFLKGFRELIYNYTDKGYKFIIYCGGGIIAREYQQAYKEIVGNNEEMMDWIGISATHMNAFLIKSIFYDIAQEEIISNPTKKIQFNKKVIVCGGWKPGWSTDYDAILIAKQLKAKQLINMSNIDYVYDKDPRKNEDAKPIKKMSWQDFREMVGNKWSAGLNAPFDPIAAKEAEKLSLEVVVISKDLKNLKNILDGKEFKGTIIC